MPETRVQSLGGKESAFGREGNVFYWESVYSVEWTSSQTKGFLPSYIRSLYSSLIRDVVFKVSKYPYIFQEESTSLLLSNLSPVTKKC